MGVALGEVRVTDGTLGMNATVRDAWAAPLDDDMRVMKLTAVYGGAKPSADGAMTTEEVAEEAKDALPMESVMVDDIDHNKDEGHFFFYYSAPSIQSKLAC